MTGLSGTASLIKTNIMIAMELQLMVLMVASVMLSLSKVKVFTQLMIQMLSLPNEFL